MGKRVIISASSDIGIALGRKWLDEGSVLVGTYRTASVEVDEFLQAGATMVQCDLAKFDSVNRAIAELSIASRGWETLVLAPGLQDPIGLFAAGEFADWNTSVIVNFTAQLQIVHALLPFRNHDDSLVPSVIFFAGGGTNSAARNYSAYTVSKIALIKMCELLDEEIPNVKFSIIGPGWVKTKIHQSTIAAKERAGDNLGRTLQKLDGDECVPMEQVVACVDWTISAPRDVVGGRNISLVFDRWGEPELDQLLREDSNMYKLRRQGNDRLVRSTPISEKTLASQK